MLSMLKFILYPPILVMVSIIMAVFSFVVFPFVKIWFLIYILIEGSRDIED